MALSAISGCTCESSVHQPYTPFGIATEVTTAPAVASATQQAPDAGTTRRFAPIQGDVLTPPSPSVRIGEWKIQAPEGMLIAQYVGVELDGDDRTEAVGWVIPQKDVKAAQQGALVLFRQGRDNLILQRFPGFIPQTPGCALNTHLAATGPTTVTWDVAAECPEGAVIPRAPTRSLVVVAPLHAEPVRLQLRLAPPPQGEQLNVEVDTSDQDGDGHDDAVITFSMQSKPPSAESVEGEQPPLPRDTSSPPSEARFVWLDRAAGMARDTSEPQASFARLGSIETVRAQGPTTSRLVAERINNARRLFAYLCKESGTYRMTDANGTSFTCGTLLEAFDNYATADVTAALTQSNPARALLAFEQSSWFGNGISAKVERALERDLRTHIPSRQASARVVEARALAPSPDPHFSPLRYVDEDALLIATEDGIWRGHEQSLKDVSDEVDPWPLLVFSPDGQRLTQLTFPCNEPTVGASSQTQAGNLEVALTTDILSPRPGLCDGRGKAPNIDFRPTAWSNEGLSAFLGPSEIGPPPRFRQPGSPVSPNGAHAIVRTKLGLVVLTRERAAFWETRLDETQLSDCVIANSGTRAACLLGTRVVELVTRTIAQD